MNFQQIVAKLKLESGRQGAAPASPATSSKDDSRLWSWVSDEWESMQTSGVDWKFLRQTRTITTAQGQATYLPAVMGGELQRLWPTVESYRARVSDGATSWWMSASMDYDEFRRLYVPGHQEGGPVTYCLTPSGSVMLGPTPDKVYTVELDVVGAPAYMVNPTDAPTGLPARHHNILAWGALKRLAIDDAAAELLQRANQEYSEAFSRLWLDQGPVVTFEPRSL